MRSTAGRPPTVPAVEIIELPASADPDITQWEVRDGPEVRAAARAVRRPDGRCFVRFTGDEASIPALAGHIHAAIGTIFAFASRERPAHREALTLAGFALDLVEHRFTVEFERALAALSRASLPQQFRLVSAADADRDRLFALDTSIRQLVPGTEGWQGRRDWFDEELTESPPFDPEGYLVAEHREGYVGLVRVWRNPEMPRLGLIGVLPSHRRTSLAPAMLARALGAAAEWGHHAFTTETSTSNPAVHRVLSRIGRVEDELWQMRLG